MTQNQIVTSGTLFSIVRAELRRGAVSVVMAASLPNGSCATPVPAASGPLGMQLRQARRSPGLEPAARTLLAPVALRARWNK